MFDMVVNALIDDMKDMFESKFCNKCENRNCSKCIAKHVHDSHVEVLSNK